MSIFNFSEIPASKRPEAKLNILAVCPNRDTIDDPNWDDPGDGKVWDYGELVQYAQEKYARNDGSAAIVRTTRYYKYSDPWHYDSEGYMDLGKRFAKALYQLTQKQ